MKHYISKTIATAMMLLFSMGAMAENTATITKTLDGTANEDAGTVEYSNGTITVTPAEGNYLTVDDLTVTKTIDGSQAQTRVDFNTAVTVTAADPDADPSGTTTYTFEVTDTKYDYEITANFHTRTSIEQFTITTDAESYTYTGEAIEPTVTVTNPASEAQSLTLNTDYTVAYTNNINVKESTAEANAPTITITGKGKYTGTATTTFTISKAAGSISFATTSVSKNVGDAAFTNNLTNTGDGAVTYTSSAANVATINETTGQVTIVGAGETTITATVADGTNYTYETKTASYTLNVINNTGTISYATTSVYKNVDDGAFTNELTNTGDGTVTYASSAANVATVNETTGQVTIVGAGETTITATVADGTNYTYEKKTAKYTLTVSNLDNGGYLLWINNVQVTMDNKADVLGEAIFGTSEPSYIFKNETNELFINNAKTPYVIESRLSNLTINVRSNSENYITKIFYNNLGDENNKGNLRITTYDNIPGQLYIDAPLYESAISGFDNVFISEEDNLHIISPEEAEYINGNFMDTDTIVRKMTIGQYITPLTNPEEHTFKESDFTTIAPDGSLVDVALGNTVIGNFLFNMNNSNDGYDTEDKSVVFGAPTRQSTIDEIAQKVSQGDLVPGSEEFGKFLILNNASVISFMVPNGRGVITIKGLSESGFPMRAKIGKNAPKNLDELERNYDINNESPKSTTIPYDGMSSQLVMLYGKKFSDTRIGRRETAHGRVYSITVKAKSTATSNPATEFGLENDEIEEVVLENSGGGESGGGESGGGSGGGDTPSTGIYSVDNDEQGANDKWYTLDGRHIEQPTQKGIYIKNKKKVVIR